MNPRIRQAICEALRCGNTRQAAAEAAGVARDTLRRWIRRGEQDNEGAFKAFYGARRAERKPCRWLKARLWLENGAQQRGGLERRRPESYREQKEQRGNTAVELARLATE
jgi:hypothetical protein